METVRRPIIHYSSGMVMLSVSVMNEEEEEEDYYYTYTFPDTYFGYCISRKRSVLFLLFPASISIP